MISLRPKGMYEAAYHTPAQTSNSSSTMTTPTFTFCVGDDTGGGNDLIRLKKGKIKGDKGKEIILSNKGEYSLKVG
jgi:hypothetical protein